MLTIVNKTLLHEDTGGGRLKFLIFRRLHWRKSRDPGKDKRDKGYVVCYLTIAELKEKSPNIALLEKENNRSHPLSSMRVRTGKTGRHLLFDYQ